MEERRILKTEWIKVGFYSLLILFLIASTIAQADFIQPDFHVRLFLLAALSFLLHFVYIFSLDRWALKAWVHYLVFVFDTITITALIYFFPSIQALFIFLYLIHILLAGLLFQRDGSIFIAVVSSFCFSILLAFSPSIEGQLLLLTLGLNNLGFFVIALLSGSLGERLKTLNVELKRTTKDLQVLKDLNSLILQSMQSGFISIDTKNSILLHNRSASEILEKNLVEGTQLGFVFPNLTEKIQLAAKRSSNLQLNYNLKINGGYKNLLILHSDIHAPDGKKIGAILIFSDQTELRRLEEEKKRNEKLAAIGKLAAGIAHEIRNPLASMSGSIEFLKANLTTASDEEKKLMQIVLREIDRLNHLITDFLDFARPEQTLTETVSLSDIVSETLEQLKNDSRFSKDLTLEVNIDDNIEVIGNRNKLIQVVMNLLINASQALDGCSIRRIQVSLQRQAEDACLRIKDSGAGMTDEVKAHLFEPFHTTKAKGTGLGLAVVHKILENHGAKIEVDSKPGDGADFLIYFPLP